MSTVTAPTADEVAEAELLLIAQIDEMSADLRKRIALFRIVSRLESLPAVTPNPPSGVTPGAVTAGASHMEQHT
jgi:hypothetical protein